jgi:transcriptional antiterminator
MKTVTFNELRRIKDSLPDGSMHQIAAELNLTVETVRNYFGGINQSAGNRCGIHIEPGPDGGIVLLDDPTILDKALIILGETSHKVAYV